MRRFSRNEQRLFIITLLAVMIYVGFNWGFKPLRQELDIIRISIADKLSAITKHQRVIRKSSTIIGAYQYYMDNFKQKKNNELVMSSILSEIEQVAGDLGLQISDMKPKRVKKEEYLNRFSVSITTQSGLSEVMKFLHVVQQRPHLFDVEEIRFDKGSRRNDASVKTNLILTRTLISQNIN